MTFEDKLIMARERHGREFRSHSPLVERVPPTFGLRRFPQELILPRVLPRVKDEREVTSAAS